MKNELCAVVFIMAMSQSAIANDKTLTVGYDYTDFSIDRGIRNIIFAELKNKVEDGTVVLNISEGKRDYGDNKSWSAMRGRTTVWYNWNSWLSSKTGVAISEDTPVFARRDFQQDISLNILPKTLFTLGYRYANYYGDTDVSAWAGGLSVYTGPLISSWRYTIYDTEDTGKSYSHIISIRINDKKGSGNTQLWLSRGTGAYTYDWAPNSLKGTIKSISIRRVQPLTESFTLGMTVGKQWHDSPVNNYHSLQMIADISWHF